MPAFVAVLLINLALLPTSVLYESSFKVELAPKTPQDMVIKYAIEYKVDPQIMGKIIECESMWKTDVINSNKWEYSVGIAQINLKAHPQITEEQAKDPEFAIKFLASKLAQGRGKMWTCYKTSKIG